MSDAEDSGALRALLAERFGDDIVPLQLTSTEVTAVGREVSQMVMKQACPRCGAPPEVPCFGDFAGDDTDRVDVEDYNQ